MTADRKNEAREKFLLGGIVVRAGLTRADCAFLIGRVAGIAKSRSELLRRPWMSFNLLKTICDRKIYSP